MVPAAGGRGHSIFSAAVPAIAVISRPREIAVRPLACPSSADYNPRSQKMLYRTVSMSQPIQQATIDSTRGCRQVTTAADFSERWFGLSRLQS